MNSRIFRTGFLALVMLCSGSIVSAQTIHEPSGDPSWSRPYQPFRIAGNLYYVGTYDLACYLITTPEGNILINTGLAASASQIKNNIESLGFKMSDLKILLTTQAHYDHVGAMAEIKNMTGAKLLVNAPEEAVLKDGGASDYAYGKDGAAFKPVVPDKLLKDHDTISLGGMNLVLRSHPGHTKGSASYVFTVKDDQRSYKVLIANMPTIVIDQPFLGYSAYPSIAQDYAYTLDALSRIEFDIWLSSHAGQFDMHSKHKPGHPYNPMVFADHEGYERSVNNFKAQYERKMQQRP